MDNFKRAVIRKIVKTLSRFGIIDDLVTVAHESIPLLFQEAEKKIMSWKKDIVFEPGEIESLQAVINYEQKIFYVYIFRVNENEPDENKKISVSRVIYRYDLKPYFNEATIITKEKILSFVNEKIKMLTDGSEKES